MSCDCDCNCSNLPSTNSAIISLRKGDDTDAMGRTITVTITSTADWVGYSARFQLGRVYKDYSDVSSKTFTISLASTDTIKLPVGRLDGYLKFIDADGKYTTDETIIPFDILPMTVRNTGLST